MSEQNNRNERIRLAGAISEQTAWLSAADGQQLTNELEERITNIKTMLAEFETAASGELAENAPATTEDKPRRGNRAASGDTEEESNKG